MFWCIFYFIFICLIWISGGIDEEYSASVMVEDSPISDANLECTNIFQSSVGF